MWDLSGDMRFDVVTRSFLINASVVLFCFDLSRKSTFDSLPKFVKRAKELTNNGFKACLVGIKSDLEANVFASDITEYAAAIDAPYFAVNSYELSTVIYLMHNVAKLGFDVGEDDSVPLPGNCPCM
jgi:GTPase SAR1 family protein